MKHRNRHHPRNIPEQSRSAAAMFTIGLLVSLLSLNNCGMLSPELDSETGSFDSRFALMLNAALSGSLTTAQQTLNSDVTFASPTASASSVSTSFTAAMAGGTNGFSSVVSGFGPPPPVPTDGIEDISNATTFSQRKTQLLRIMSATSPDDCRFRPNLAPSPPAALCFGPKLFYMGLPAGDQGGPAGANGMRPPKDLGIWNITNQATGEACLAAQVNGLSDDIGVYLSSAIGLAAMMQCHARFVFGKTLPAAGETRDLTALFSSKVGEVGSAQTITVSQAQLRRDADVNGNPVFSSSMSITFGTQGNLTFNLDHSPNADDNDLFRGNLALSIRNPAGLSPGLVCGGAKPKQLGVSVAYEKNSTTSLRYRLRKALYCTENLAIFNPTTRQIDLSSKYNSGANPTGWIDNAFDITLNLNPNDSTGTFTSAWQAQNADNATRAFALTLGSTSGTGFFGFGPDIAALDVNYTNVSTHVITGMHCNWLNNFAAGAKQPKVQRQGMTFSTTDNKWINDATVGVTQVTFAPTNDCNKTGGDGHRYSTVAALTSSPMTNDHHLNAGSVTNNLVDLTAMSTAIGTLPTRPTPLK